MLTRSWVNSVLDQAGNGFIGYVIRRCTYRSQIRARGTHLIAFTPDATHLNIEEMARPIVLLQRGRWSKPARRARR
jgi:hypothetical protein